MTKPHSPLRVLIAPDSFKGTMTALEAACAMERGVCGASAEMVIQVDVDICPLADGGEGTLDVVRDALGAREHCESVSGSITEKMIDARWIQWIDNRNKKCGLIESASVVGLGLVAQEARDPGRVSTKGLGELVAGAMSQGVHRIYIALGGSACIDGGVGMASVLGASFFDSNGKRMVNPVGDDLVRIARIEWTACEVEVVGLCDVNNTLLGPEGAARVYGPQKGATPEQVDKLEDGLENLVHVCRDGGLHSHQDSVCAGAAGGLGFGLATFHGAELIRGSEWVCDVVGFDERVARADLVLTGEGRLDAQTSHGKVIEEVSRRAGRTGTPVIAVAGQVDASVEPSALGLREVYSLDQIAGGVDAALREPERWLEKAVKVAVHDWASK